MENAVWGAGGAMLVITALLALLTVVVKKLLKGFLDQNGSLISEALANMKANTAAIAANTQVTQQLSEKLAADARVQEEREKNRKEQMDRIERYVAKLNRNQQDTR